MSHYYEDIKCCGKLLPKKINDRHYIIIDSKRKVKRK